MFKHVKAKMRTLGYILLMSVILVVIGNGKSTTSYAQMVDHTRQANVVTQSVDEAETESDTEVTIDGDIVMSMDDYQDLLAGGYKLNLWCNSQYEGKCQIPYDFDPGANLAVVEEAVSAWEKVANVDFIQCAFTSCPGFVDYLHFQDSDGNNSKVGRVGGRQDVNITSWNNTFVVVHEVGHALGLLHEHSRPDRDNYITVRAENILGDKQDQLARIDGMNFYGPYDFGSIMHYGTCAFSINLAECQRSMGANFATIELKAEYSTFSSVMGQRTHLSEQDKRIISYLYPPKNWRFLDGTYTEEDEVGLLYYPFKTLNNALNGANGVPVDGVLWIRPGEYSAAGVYNRPMIWQNTFVNSQEPVVLR